MTASEIFDRHLGKCPLVAILRGVTPGESTDIAKALFDSGIGIIEVPLNSPRPFDSIERIAMALGDDALVGAGTVLDPADVERVREAGGRIIVSPNTNEAVVRSTVSCGLVSAPGFFTPGEAFAALSFGAHALKLFPAEAGSPKLVKALRAVLPDGVPLLVVGGVTPDTLGPWLESGATGFGLGSALYAPGQSASETAGKAKAFVESVERR